MEYNKKSSLKFLDLTKLSIDNSANMDYNIRANVLVICVKFHMDMFNDYGAICKMKKK